MQRSSGAVINMPRGAQFPRHQSPTTASPATPIGMQAGRWQRKHGVASMKEEVAPISRPMCLTTATTPMKRTSGLLAKGHGAATMKTLAATFTPQLPTTAMLASKDGRWAGLQQRSTSAAHTKTLPAPRMIAANGKATGSTHGRSRSRSTAATRKASAAPPPCPTIAMQAFPIGRQGGQSRRNIGAVNTRTKAALQQRMSLWTVSQDIITGRKPGPNSSSFGAVTITDEAASTPPHCRMTALRALVTWIEVGHVPRNIGAAASMRSAAQQRHLCHMIVMQALKDGRLVGQLQRRSIVAGTTTVAVDSLTAQSRLTTGWIYGLRQSNTFAAITKT